jgi:hypothetical protein
MLDIPVSFNHNGLTYQGTLSEVIGAGFSSGGNWHLTVQKGSKPYHQG